MTNTFSTLLNAFRWLAALLVVLNHVRHLFLIDYKNVIDKNLLIKAFYFITGLGHEAVIIFFVISGFLVGGLSLKKWPYKVSITDYFIARISRIYIVLIPALIIGSGLDWVGLNYFNNSEIYTNSAKYETSSLAFICSEQLNKLTFIGNIFNLQGILVPTLGSNGPLWSLAFEWWYYILFSCMGLLIYNKTLLINFFSITVIVSLIIFLPTKLTLWMIIWFLGIGVYFYGESSWPKPSPFIALVILSIVLFLSRTSHNTNNLIEPESLFTEFSRDFFLGTAFSIFLISLYKQTNKIPFDYLHLFFANFSYSIYLFHFPFLIFLSALLHDFYNIQFMQQPSNINIILVLSFCLSIYIYGYLMFLITEKHSIKLRSFITSIITK